MGLGSLPERNACQRWLVWKGDCVGEIPSSRVRLRCGLGFSEVATVCVIIHSAGVDTGGRAAKLVVTAPFTGRVDDGPC